MNVIKLYLDDIRTPPENGWVLVKNYKEFVDYITEKGLPDVVSFDHDLGDKFNEREMTGYDCAKWLCEYCLENGIPMPQWHIHSANPVGRMNIAELLKGFERRFN